MRCFSRQAVVGVGLVAGLAAAPGVVSELVPALGLGSALPIDRSAAQTPPTPPPPPTTPGTTPMTPPVTTGSLTLRFTGLKSSRGAILAAVYDSEAAYGSGQAPSRAVKAEVADGTASVEIMGLAPGAYAVKSFHDLKGDGKLTFNVFGLPLEPVAFSNNAKIRGKAPSWSETAFTVGPGSTTQTIVID